MGGRVSTWKGIPTTRSPMSALCPNLNKHLQLHPTAQDSPSGSRIVRQGEPAQCYVAKHPLGLNVPSLLFLKLCMIFSRAFASFTSQTLWRYHYRMKTQLIAKSLTTSTKSRIWGIKTLLVVILNWLLKVNSAWFQQDNHENSTETEILTTRI